MQQSPYVGCGVDFHFTEQSTIFKNLYGPPDSYDDLAAATLSSKYPDEMKEIVGKFHIFGYHMKLWQKTYKKKMQKFNAKEKRAQNPSFCSLLRRAILN